MLVQTDSRRRITLPASSAIKPGDALDMEILEDGRIVLVPIEPVPRHQLWAWTVESKETVSSSLPIPVRPPWSKPPNRRRRLPRGGRVRIEIRPVFDESVMAAELPIRKAAAKMLQTLQALDLPSFGPTPA